MNNGELKGFQRNVKESLPFFIGVYIGCSGLIFLGVIVVAISLKIGLWIVQW